MPASGDAPRSPAHIRWIGRVAAVTALVIAAFAIWMVWGGLPAPLATAMNDAEWAPCIAKYADATTTRDSARVDTWVLRPRTRFTPAVTCGTLRRDRAEAPVVVRELPEVPVAPAEAPVPSPGA